MATVGLPGAGFCWNSNPCRSSWAWVSSQWIWISDNRMAVLPSNCILSVFSKQTKLFSDGVVSCFLLNRFFFTAERFPNFCHPLVNEDVLFVCPNYSTCGFSLWVSFTLKLDLFQIPFHSGAKNPNVKKDDWVGRQNKLGYPVKRSGTSLFWSQTFHWDSQSSSECGTCAFLTSLEDIQDWTAFCLSIAMILIQKHDTIVSSNNPASSVLFFSVGSYLSRRRAGVVGAHF